MAFRASAGNLLICLPKADLRIYVVSNPGQNNGLFCPLTYEVWPRLDLLVYTSAEFERMVDEENPFLLRVLEEGVDVL